MEDDPSANLLREAKCTWIAHPDEVGPRSRRTDATPMKVFLSWSGKHSQEIAIALRDWLPRVIQLVEPWLSADIEKGSRWSEEVSTSLEESSVGIICLTPENKNSRWILFEAGALSKTPGAKVCTYLHKLTPVDILPPLAQFQHTRADRDDTQELVRTINRAVGESGSKALGEKDLDEVFEMWWPRLETSLEAIEVPSVAGPVRTDRDILEEILEGVRFLRERERTPSSMAAEWFDRWSEHAEQRWSDLNPDLVRALLRGVIATQASRVHARTVLDNLSEDPFASPSEPSPQTEEEDAGRAQD
jgi:hypothetical protein